jgi:hypothetical protein
LLMDPDLKCGNCFSSKVWPYRERNWRKDLPIDWLLARHAWLPQFIWSGL